MISLISATIILLLEVFMIEIWDAYDRQFNKIENVRLIRELREETGIESSNL